MTFFTRTLLTNLLHETRQACLAIDAMSELQIYKPKDNKYRLHKLATLSALVNINCEVNFKTYSNNIFDKNNIKIFFKLNYVISGRISKYYWTKLQHKRQPRRFVIFCWLIKKNKNKVFVNSKWSGEAWTNLSFTTFKWIWWPDHFYSKEERIYN